MMAFRHQFCSGVGHVLGHSYARVVTGEDVGGDPTSLASGKYILLVAAMSYVGLAFLLALFLRWRCAAVVRLALRCGALLLFARASRRREQLWGLCGFGTERCGRACSASASSTALQRCAGYLGCVSDFYAIRFLQRVKTFFIKKI